MKAWFAFCGVLWLLFSPTAWAADKIPLCFPEQTIVYQRASDRTCLAAMISLPQGSSFVFENE